MEVAGADRVRDDRNTRADRAQLDVETVVLVLVLVISSRVAVAVVVVVPSVIAGVVLGGALLAAIAISPRHSVDDVEMPRAERPTPRATARRSCSSPTTRS